MATKETYCMPITEFWYQLTPIKVYWKGPTKTNQGRDHSQWKKYIFLPGPLSPTAEDTCKRKHRVAHFKWIKPKSNKLTKQRKHKRKLINNQDPISSWKPGTTTKKCIPHPRLDPPSPTFNSYKVLFSTSQHLWTYNYLYSVDISRLSWFQKDSTQTHVWWQSDDIILNDTFMELPCFLGMNLSALDYKMDNFLQKMQELYISWDLVSDPVTFLQWFLMTLYTLYFFKYVRYGSWAMVQTSGLFAWL